MWVPSLDYSIFYITKAKYHLGFKIQWTNLIIFNIYCSSFFNYCKYISFHCVGVAATYLFFISWGQIKYIKIIRLEAVYIRFIQRNGRWKNFAGSKEKYEPYLIYFLIGHLTFHLLTSEANKLGIVSGICHLTNICQQVTRSLSHTINHVADDCPSHMVCDISVKITCLCALCSQKNTLVPVKSSCHESLTLKFLLLWVRTNSTIHCTLNTIHVSVMLNVTLVDFHLK